MAAHHASRRPARHRRRRRRHRRRTVLAVPQCGTKRQRRLPILPLAAGAAAFSPWKPHNQPSRPFLHRPLVAPSPCRSAAGCSGRPSALRRALVSMKARRALRPESLTRRPARTGEMTKAPRSVLPLPIGMSRRTRTFAAALGAAATRSTFSNDKVSRSRPCVEGAAVVGPTLGSVTFLARRSRLGVDGLALAQVNIDLVAASLMVRLLQAAFPCIKPGLEAPLPTPESPYFRSGSLRAESYSASVPHRARQAVHCAQRVHAAAAACAPRDSIRLVSAAIDSGASSSPADLRRIEGSKAQGASDGAFDIDFLLSTLATPLQPGAGRERNGRRRAMGVGSRWSCVARRLTSSEHARYICARSQYRQWRSCGGECAAARS